MVYLSQRRSKCVSELGNAMTRLGGDEMSCYGRVPNRPRFFPSIQFQPDICHCLSVVKFAALFTLLIAALGASLDAQSAPTVTSLSQSSGAVGAPISITGTNFGTTQGTSTVTFNGTVAAVNNWNASTIAVTVPSGATSGNVVVHVGGLDSTAFRSR